MKHPNRIFPGRMLYHTMLLPDKTIDLKFARHLISGTDLPANMLWHIFEYEVFLLSAQCEIKREVCFNYSIMGQCFVDDIY